MVPLWRVEPFFSLLIMFRKKNGSDLFLGENSSTCGTILVPLSKGWSRFGSTFFSQWIVSLPKFIAQCVRVLSFPYSEGWAAFCNIKKCCSRVNTLHQNEILWILYYWLEELACRSRTDENRTGRWSSNRPRQIICWKHPCPYPQNTELHPQYLTDK